MKCVENKNLVGAFTGFALHVVHEATAKHEHLPRCLMSDTSVPRPPLYVLIRREVEIAPERSVLARHQHGHLVVAAVILAAHKVAVVVYASHGGSFAGRRYPPLDLHGLQLGVEGVPLLHALDVGLETAGQALSQLVTRDVVTRSCFELLRLVIIEGLTWLQNLDFHLRSTSPRVTPYQVKS